LNTSGTIPAPSVREAALVVRILADVREQASGVPALLADNGIAVEMKRLPNGDYDVGGGALVERKTVRGLHAAIVDGTFWPQLGRLRKAARFPYALFEGRDLDDGPLTATAIRGACLALTDLGVTMIRSTNVRDSALWLARLAYRRCQTELRNRPAYAQRPKRPAGFPAAEAALACVPGISSVYAQALLARFGSLADVTRATSAEWQQVAGIGPQRAQALAATLYTRHPSSHPSHREGWRGPAT
jgi:ERCC4-type nuclease